MSIARRVSGPPRVNGRHGGAESAAAITEFAAAAVPELLQTAAYAEAMGRWASAGAGDLASEFDSGGQEYAEWLARRQQVLARARYEAVLDESVLHRGPAGVLSGQLAHLAALVSEGQLVVRVLPFTAEIMPPGPLSYLRFAGPLPSVAVLPSPAGTVVVDDRDALKTCASLLDRLRAQALPPAESACLITERAAVPDPGDAGKQA